MNYTTTLNKQLLAFVVEDNMTMRLLMRESLEQAGFSVREAENGVRALELFEELNPDVILLDIEMPELDGFDTCVAIRKHPRGEHTPILMVTGNDDIESVNRAYDVGATDFIGKPINWGVLGHRVRYMLRAATTYSELQKSEAHNSAILHAIPDIMLQIDKNGTLVDYLSGSDHSMVISNDDVGEPITAIMPQDVADLVMKNVHKALSTGERQLYEYQIKNDHDMHSFEARVVVCGDDQALAIVRDITQRKYDEEKIHNLAYYDTLTGLPNRQYFLNKIDNAINMASNDDKLAVLYIDLDDFKRVNDILGHTAGDELLKKISIRLNACLRTTDSIARSSEKNENEDNKLSRLGGDEFVVLLSDIHQKDVAVSVVRRILASLIRPFMINAHEFVITSSIGIAMYPDDGVDSDVLLKNAVAAVHHVKQSGRNDFKFYTSSLNEHSMKRLSIESKLRKAIARNEFELYYQPKINILRNEVIGVEALIRWKNEELGLVMPNDFIPMAEESNLIVPIGEWVINAACEQNQSWVDAGMQPIKVAVNLSSKQFQYSDIDHTVDDALLKSGLASSLLELEITESLIMQDVDSTKRLLNAFKEMGVGLSLDDFGTGYSSLSYLKRFPFDTLKIDRSFVKDMGIDKGDRSLVSAIVAMAHSLDMVAVAEGVETEQQLQLIKELNCDQMQGYLYSKPLPADEMSELLRSQQGSIGNAIIN